MRQADAYGHNPKTILGQFVEEHHVIIMVVTLSLIFLRLPLGMFLDNREPSSETPNNLHHRLVGMMYLFAWWKVKNKENKVFALILNIMLVLAFIIFFGILFGLIFSGELK